MHTLLRRLSPLLLFFFLFSGVGAVSYLDEADARSRSGGRSFGSPAQRQSMPPSQMNRNQGQQSSGFGRGLMGGLLGGAIGSMLFGGMFGMNGSGMGILPLLLLGGAGYFFYKRFVRKPDSSSSSGYQPPPRNNGGLFPPRDNQGGFPIPPLRDPTPPISGLEAIRRNDPGFDEQHFLEVASDVFFKVQAGWMRRDLPAFRHLLGAQLASEYEQHFAEMKRKGQLNKLESIAIRKVEIVDSGTNNGEDYVTVLFTANLLDYTVDDQSGALIEGSMTEPVKFAEQWTWARPVGSENWRLEGVEVVNE